MTDRPNFLIVMTDQQRLDTLGCYGNCFVDSRNLDAFALEAACFETCCTTYPVCTPARASLWTGLYPHAHGVIDNVYGIDDAFADVGHEQQTVFGRLRAVGYTTAYSGKWHLGEAQPGWADYWHGFNSLGGHWEDGRQAFQGGRYLPNIQTDRLIKYLQGQRVAERPFIAVQSYYPPHDPYSAPLEYYAPYRGRGIPFPAYYAAVSAMDACFGRIAKALVEYDLAERTVVVFLSDHGETFGGREDSIHKHVCYDEAIRVPLILRAPGERSRRISEPVGLHDLVPTILDYAGLPIPPEIHGESLRPLIEGRKETWRKANYIQNRTRINGYIQRCIRTSDWKLVLSQGNPGLMFDLQTDPEELFNLTGDHTVDPHNQYRHFPDRTKVRHSLVSLLHEIAWACGDAVGATMAKEAISRPGEAK